MPLKFSLRAAVVAILLLFPYAQAASAASVTVFTDRTAFETAAFGDVIEDDFADDELPDGTTVDSDWPSFGISGGLLHDRVQPGVQETTYRFTSAIFGFGGDWDLAGPGGQGTGIALTFTFTDGTTQAAGTELPRSLSFDFFGFVTDVAIREVLVQAGTDPFGIAETHDLDLLLLANPEPGSLALFGLGGLGLLALSRRRRRAARAL